VATHGDRYSIAGDSTARQEGWRLATPTGLAGFDNTITFAELNNSQRLARWDAVVRKLHGGHIPDEPGVWPAAIVYWRAVGARLISRNPRTKAAFARGSSARVARE
jgi:hypothetical protein